MRSPEDRNVTETAPAELQRQNIELRHLLGAAIEQLRAAGIDSFELPAAASPVPAAEDTTPTLPVRTSACGCSWRRDDGRQHYLCAAHAASAPVAAEGLDVEALARLADDVVRDLFCNSYGVAERLELTTSEGNGIGGWGRRAVHVRILAALRAVAETRR